MPESAYWESFFDSARCLKILGLQPDAEWVADFGCGYGTFSLPAAQMIQGRVLALDLDQKMLDHISGEAAQANIQNIDFVLRDFIAQGTGAATASVDYSMLFNILHHEQPVSLLQEAYRIAKPGGKVGIMHWRHDAATPRGPDLSIRPRPEQCVQWAVEAGLVWVEQQVHDLPPWHYGLVLQKPES